MRNKNQKIEIADILRDKIEALRTQTEFNISTEQWKAVKAIINCRTAKMGGHINKCNYCGYETQAYSSCRNRNCPKCQYTKQQQWIDKINSNLPDTNYYHLVFTIPSTLHSLFYLNQNECYSMLFKAASQSLKEVALMPNLLGAETGAIAILHTWGQTLTYHPHIHMIVPSGGLSSDGMEWMQSPKNYFLPVKVLGKVFRRKFCELLKKLWNNELNIPNAWTSYNNEEVKEILCSKNWNVNAEKAFGGVKFVVNYLANYIHRIAISNHRIIDYDGKFVKFRYKDHRTGISNKVMKLPVMEFIRRFLQHVLPSGFYKTRYYGIFASVNTQTKRALVFCLLEQDSNFSLLEGLTGYEVYRHITGKDPCVCPICNKGKLRAVLKLQDTG